MFIIIGEGRYVFTRSDIRNPKLVAADKVYQGPRKGFVLNVPDSAVRYQTRKDAETAAIAVEHYSHVPMRTMAVS